MTLLPPYPDSRRLLEKSLRGSETTEAISKAIENEEIATLPSVARNDKKEITAQFLDREGWYGV